MGPDGRIVAAVRDCYLDRGKANTSQLIKHAFLGFTFAAAYEYKG
jgi:hypothetical protein